MAHVAPVVVFPRLVVGDTSIQQFSEKTIGKNQMTIFVLNKRNRCLLYPPTSNKFEMATIILRLDEKT